MKRILLTLTAAWLAGPVSGGWFSRGPKTDSNEQLAKLFGPKAAFSATAQVSVRDRRDRETHTAEIQYAFRDGKFRAEIDMTKTKVGEKRPEAMGAVASMGMNVIVSLHRPDKRTNYVVYPGLQAYCDFPITDAPAEGEGQPPQLEKTELGRETVDGHPCVKYKMVLTDAAGGKQEMLVWEATDLDQFPIQTQVSADADTVTTLFRNVRQQPPPEVLFEIPSSYKRYDSVDELMMGSIQQMLGGGDKE